MFDYIVRKVFGLYAADQISDPDNDLMGLFSNTFVHRSFLLVDELENSRHFTGKLKNMVTCDKLRYEKKDKDTMIKHLSCICHLFVMRLTASSIKEKCTRERVSLLFIFY